MRRRKATVTTQRIKQTNSQLYSFLAALKQIINNVEGFFIFFMQWQIHHESSSDLSPSLHAERWTDRRGVWQNTTFHAAVTQCVRTVFNHRCQSLHPIKFYHIKIKEIYRKTLTSPEVFWQQTSDHDSSDSSVLHPGSLLLWLFTPTNRLAQTQTWYFGMSWFTQGHNGRRPLVTRDAEIPPPCPTTAINIETQHESVDKTPLQNGVEMSP